MYQFASLGTPPPTPPSAIAQFLAVEHTRRESFKTTEFAAYFSLTIREAQSVLNQYVEDGLLTYVGLKDGIESWARSRNGRQAIGLGNVGPRLARKDLGVVKKALHDVDASLKDFGVTEICVGGLPAFGKLYGPLIIGVRLAHEPFTQLADEQTLVKVFNALPPKLRASTYSILLFGATIPERLQRRIILTGPDTGSEVTASRSELDLAEVSHRRGWDIFLKTKGRGGIEFLERYSYFEGVEGLPYELLKSIREDFAASDAAIQCEKSPVHFEVETGEYLARLAPDFSYLLSFWNNQARFEWARNECPAEFFAAAEYLIETGQFERRRPPKLSEGSGWNWGALQQGSMSDRRENIQACLQLRRDWMAKERTVYSAKKSRKTVAQIDYYAVFDCLNFQEPYLVGFVRQAASNAGSFRKLEDWWRIVLRGASSSPAHELSKAGFNSSYLSLFVRPATAEEVLAYDGICKSVGATLRYITCTQKRGQGLRAHQRYEAEDVGEVPLVLAAAKASEPMLPKLLMGRAWRSNSGTRLFDFIPTMAPLNRERVASLIINLQDVSMAEFAERASASACTDPVVLASDLTDAWQFSAQGARWSATLKGESWSVELESKSDILSITIELAGCFHRQQLSPYASDFGTAYKGYLSSLYPFMREVPILHYADLENYFTKRAEAEKKLTPTKEDRLAWFVLAVGDYFSGGLFDWDSRDGTAWPRLSVEGGDE